MVRSMAGPAVAWAVAMVLLLAGPAAVGGQGAPGREAVRNVTLRVVVIDELQPKPVPLTDFRITKVDGSAVRQVRTDEAGRIILRLDPGDYRLQSVRPVDFRGRSITWSRRFTVSAAEDTALTVTDADALSSQGAPVEPAAKVAVVPWVFVGGTDGARRAAGEFLDTVLAKAALEVAPHSRIDAAWARSAPAPKPGQAGEVPAAGELLRFGQAQGVDYVAAGRAAWHTRSIWIGFGPKTKSDCTVDLTIVDVRRSERAVEARQVKMDSTAKEDALKAAGAIVLTPLFTVVSGGPKTPHEQRAVQLAIAKALQPWLAARAPVGEPQDRRIR